MNHQFIRRRKYGVYSLFEAVIQHYYQTFVWRNDKQYDEIVMITLWPIFIYWILYSSIILSKNSILAINLCYRNILYAFIHCLSIYLLIYLCLFITIKSLECIIIIIIICNQRWFAMHNRKGDWCNKLIFTAHINSSFPHGWYHYSIVQNWLFWLTIIYAEDILRTCCYHETDHWFLHPPKDIW